VAFWRGNIRLGENRGATIGGSKKGPRRGRSVGTNRQRYRGDGSRKQVRWKEQDGFEPKGAKLGLDARTRVRKMGYLVAGDAS